MKGSLLRLLARRSYLQGPHLLASGKASEFYLDCKRATMTREGLLDTVYGMSEKLHLLVSDEGWAWPRYIAGTGVGGGQIVPAFILFSRTDRFEPLYVRSEAKPHGTRKLVEPGPYDVLREALMRNPNAKTILLEDVVSTGGSAIRAVRALRENGYDVEGVISIVDRDEGGREALAEENVKFSSIFTREEVMQAYQAEIAKGFQLAP